MSLNIKTAEAHRLAAELAAATGESISTAVTIAIRERLARERARPGDLSGRLLAIGKSCAARLVAPYDRVDHAELLYDDLGLPR